MISRSNISVQVAGRILVAVIAFEIFLVAVFLADAILDEPSRIFHRLFDLDGERNALAFDYSLGNRIDKLADQVLLKLRE